MRRLAQELGVVPMALHEHVANKEELLNGMVDVVFSEIEAHGGDVDWMSAMRRRAGSVREALGRHGCAIGVTETASPGRPTSETTTGSWAASGKRLLIRDGDPRRRVHLVTRADPRRP